MGKDKSVFFMKLRMLGLPPFPRLFQGPVQGFNYVLIQYSSRTQWPQCLIMTAPYSHLFPCAFSLCHFPLCTQHWRGCVAAFVWAPWWALMVTASSCLAPRSLQKEKGLRRLCRKCPAVPGGREEPDWKREAEANLWDSRRTAKKESKSKVCRAQPHPHRNASLLVHSFNYVGYAVTELASIFF